MVTAKIHKTLENPEAIENLAPGLDPHGHDKLSSLHW